MGKSGNAFITSSQRRRASGASRRFCAASAYRTAAHSFFGKRSLASVNPASASLSRPSACSASALPMNASRLSGQRSRSVSQMFKAPCQSWLRLAFRASSVCSSKNSIENPSHEICRLVSCWTKPQLAMVGPWQQRAAVLRIKLAAKPVRLRKHGAWRASALLHALQKLDLNARRRPPLSSPAAGASTRPSRRIRQTVLRRARTRRQRP